MSGHDQAVICGQRSQGDDHLRQGPRIGGEPGTHGIEVRQAFVRKVLLEQRAKFGFTAAVMRNAEKFNHGPARCPLRRTLKETLERPAIRIAREQAVAIDQPQQRHGLAAQAVDHVAVIHDMAVLSVCLGAAARHRHQAGAAHEQLKPVVIEPHPQTVTDKP